MDTEPQPSLQQPETVSVLETGLAQPNLEETKTVDVGTTNSPFSKTKLLAAAAFLLIVGLAGAFIHFSSETDSVVKTPTHPVKTLSNQPSPSGAIKSAPLLKTFFASRRNIIIVSVAVGVFVLAAAVLISLFLYFTLSDSVVEPVKDTESLAMEGRVEELDTENKPSLHKAFREEHRFVSGSIAIALLGVLYSSFFSVLNGLKKRSSLKPLQNESLKDYITRNRFFCLCVSILVVSLFCLIGFGVFSPEAFVINVPRVAVVGYFILTSLVLVFTCPFFIKKMFKTPDKLTTRQWFAVLLSAAACIIVALIAYLFVHYGMDIVWDQSVFVFVIFAGTTVALLLFVIAVFLVTPAEFRKHVNSHMRPLFGSGS